MDILTLLLLFIAIELFESNWQKADTLFGLLNNNYLIYKKNIFLYFILNGSFFYALFLAVYLNNFTFWMLSIIGIKFFDIAFKLTLLNRIDSGYDIEQTLPNMTITPLLRYINVIIYPASFYIATI